MSERESRGQREKALRIRYCVPEFCERPFIRNHLLPLIVVAIGFLQVAGYLTGNTRLREIGYLTVASPLPIVFTDRFGVLEDFASNFYLEILDAQGQTHAFELDAEHFAKIKGPFVRKAAYAEPIIYAPILDPEIRDGVIRFGMCRGTVIEEAFGIKEARVLKLHIETKTRGRASKWDFEFDCRV